MTTTTGLWQALLSAIADTIHEVSGSLMGRLSAAYTSGQTTITLSETHRWPDAGRIVVNGVTGFYTGKTLTALTGLIGEDGAPGLGVEGRDGDVVTLISTQSDMDRLKDAFFVQTAEGSDLDTFGRNYGMRRPRGLSDSQYRALLLASLFVEGGTVYAMEKVLSAVLGAGNFTLHEDHEGTALTVYATISATISSDYRGKSYLVGLEPQARATAITVDADHDPTLVYGVWDSDDPGRLGTNYAEATTSLTETAPDALVAGVDTFSSSDADRYAVRQSDGAIWKILSVLDAKTLQVGTKVRSNGSSSAGAPLEFRASEPVFRTWMVGHKLIVLSGLSAGSYTIVAVNEGRNVLTLTGASFVTETSLRWFIRPDFGGSVVNYRINRATWSGSTITTPLAMPANVLIDYTTIPSAQVVPAADVDAADRHAFYLFDETYLTGEILDIVRAAGVRIVVLTE